MGTWGAGLFDDDIALDVREGYLELLASGISASEATRSLLDAFQPALSDTDDGPVIWLALAATQWEYGAFGPDVQENALRVLASGESLARWEEAGQPDSSRRRLLDRLAQKLRTPLPPVRRPRRRKRESPPPSSALDAPDGRARASIAQLGHGPWIQNQPQSQVCCEMDTPTGRGGGHVALFSCSWDQVLVEWKDPDTLCIHYPAGSLMSGQGPIHDPKPEAYYSGRIVNIVYAIRPSL